MAIPTSRITHADDPAAFQNARLEAAARLAAASREVDVAI